jgi:hypothetical protein
MNPIFEAALEIEAICRAAGFQFCFIERWGQPHMTADVDLTVVTGFGQEERYVDHLLGALRGRIPDARDFALQYRTRSRVETRTGSISPVSWPGSSSTAT